MSHTDRERAIKCAVRGHFADALRDVDALVRAVNCDLFYGDSLSEDYPGFESACRTITRSLDAVRGLYVELDSGYATTLEPEFDDDVSEWVAVSRRECLNYLIGRELAKYIR
jgi:hypothetical protein